jgi:hypothetical protein
MVESIIEIAKRVRADNGLGFTHEKKQRSKTFAEQSQDVVALFESFHSGIIAARKLADIEVTLPDTEHPVLQDVLFTYRKRRLLLILRRYNGHMYSFHPLAKGHGRQWSFEKLAELIYAALVEPYEQGQDDEE